MPFKHKNISYGLPQDDFDKEFIKEICYDLNEVLELKRKPVGIKLCYCENEYNSFEWDEPNGKLSYCCMVEKATRGMKFKATLENINCDGGTTALALEPSNTRIESGMEYFSYNLYATVGAARRAREGVKGLYRTGVETYGVFIGPLDEFSINPDVVIFIANPYQTMRLQQGYAYYNGDRVNASLASMQGICSEATVEPYLSGKMNISVLCPSTRFLAKWKDEEMAVGIPFEKFENIAKGVMSTSIKINK
ncbi:DUF169 domain-containing protein [Clostridium sp.]|uniref:DUF169 domain-containing protein n=1 Tax=Clostridium sp. TaxID=1506 RepID=UPI003F2FDC13